MANFLNGPLPRKVYRNAAQVYTRLYFPEQLLSGKTLVVFFFLLLSRS